MEPQSVTTGADHYMSRIPIHDISNCLASLLASGKTVLIGIDGGSGAGKTTFVKWFAERIDESVSAPVSIVLTDLLYRPVADRWTGPVDEMPIGYDLDWERIRDEVIVPLRHRRRARFRLYDWVADRLNETVEIEAGGVTIIDGVFALRKELRDYYDLRVWFSCPLATRASRLLTRGDASQVEIDYWLPIEERYHKVHAPEEAAHLVIDSTANMSTAGEHARLEVVRWSPPDTPQRSRREAPSDSPPSAESGASHA